MLTLYIKWYFTKPIYWNNEMIYFQFYLGLLGLFSPLDHILIHWNVDLKIKFTIPFSFNFLSLPYRVLSIYCDIQYTIYECNQVRGVIHDKIKVCAHIMFGLHKMHDIVQIVSLVYD